MQVDYFGEYMHYQPDIFVNAPLSTADIVHNLCDTGGVRPISNNQSHAPIRIVPHPRTLRKARTQVQLMVATGFSTRRIRSYLHRFVLWWVNTTRIWNYDELIKWFVDASFDINPKAFAVGRLIRRLRESHIAIVHGWHDVGVDLTETAIAA